MEFLRDPFWEFIISTFISVTGIIIPILIGIFQSKSGSGSSSMSVSPSANPTGCWIVPTIIVSIVLIIFIVLFGTAFAFISNVVSTVFHSPGIGQNPGLIFNNSPDQVLKTYCSSIQSGAYQDAYDQYSRKLKSEVSSAQFTQMWSDKHLGSCAHDTIQTSGNTATTTLSTEDFFTKQVQSYSVTLIQDGSDGWKIDSIQSQ